MWLSVDPFAQIYPGFSSYVFTGNNPLIYVDKTGRNFEPVFNSKGDFLGTTKEGFTGEVLIYDGSEELELESISASTLKDAGASTYDEVRGELSNKAKSRIWTRIVQEADGKSFNGVIFDMSTIDGGKIGFKKSKTGNWTTNTRTGGITGSDKYKYETTVENIVSSVVVHEWLAHLILGVSDANHSDAYIQVAKYIASNAEFSNVTESYKDFTLEAWTKYYIEEEGKGALDNAAAEFIKRVRQ